MLCHGAFLRWPPWQAAGCGLANPNRPEECAISHFHSNRATTASLDAAHWRGVRDPALALYDEEARTRLRSTVAALRHVAKLYAAKTPTIRVRGDRAAVVFLEDAGHRLAPWFFRHTSEGWRLDGGMYPGVIVYNHLNQWRFVHRDHTYAFAFDDFSIDSHGFASPPPR
jgi:hypothetical protein